MNEPPTTGYGDCMPSLMNRITQFGKSSQGRGLMSQVQERLTGGGGKSKSKTRGRRANTRRPVGRSGRTAGRGRRTR
jgi:hypothetical protein